MIRSFKSRAAEQLFNRERPKGLPANLHRVALRKLRMLNRARQLRDLRVPPANRLEGLKGNRKGQHSIRVKDHYRICFRWRGGDAFDVEIVDYRRG